MLVVNLSVLQRPTVTIYSSLRTSVRGTRSCLGGASNSSMVFSVSLSVCGHGGVPDVKLEQIEER